MKSTPRPRVFRFDSRFKTSTRVEASSMEMISSTTRILMSNKSARRDQDPLELTTGELMGELVEHVDGVEAHGLKRRLHTLVPLGVRHLGEVGPLDRSRTLGQL